MDQNIQIIPFSEASPEIRQAFEGRPEGTLIRKNDQIRVKAGDQIFLFADNPQFSALVQTLTQHGRSGDLLRTEQDDWLMLLRGASETAIRNLRQAGIRQKAARCVLLFRPCQEAARQSDRQLFIEIAPIEETDRILLLDDGDIALVMGMEDRTEEEAYEFASAMMETMESEAGMKWCAGIGRCAEDLSGISTSCGEARAALETGLRFRMQGRVFVYRRQMLERLVDAVPAEVRKRLRTELLTAGTRKLLTDEMTETIQVFFENDLSLSSASRQLFIHRNTLLYRLDKIRKETGLDLRKFQDAVVFRLILMMPEDSDKI